MRITSYTINKGYTTMEIKINTLSYFLILRRNYKKLYRLTSTIHNLIENKTGNKQNYISVYNPFPIM